MTFDIEIELGMSKSINVHGESVETIVWQKVCAEQLDDIRSEFYQGAAVGLKPEIIFCIHDFEYDGEEYVRFNNHVYVVLRAAKREQYRELVCSTFQGVIPNR